jgi:hypothetical protein
MNLQVCEKKDKKKVKNDLVILKKVYEFYNQLFNKKFF